MGRAGPPGEWSFLGLYRYLLSFTVYSTSSFFSSSYVRANTRELRRPQKNPSLFFLTAYWDETVPFPVWVDGRTRTRGERGRGPSCRR